MAKNVIPEPVVKRLEDFAEVKSRRTKESELERELSELRAKRHALRNEIEAAEEAAKAADESGDHEVLTLLGRTSAATLRLRDARPELTNIERAISIRERATALLRRE